MPLRSRAVAASAMPMILLRLGGGVLLAGALALFVLAFTQFDGSGVPQPGPQDQLGYEERLMRDAQLSAALGLSGCVALLGAFACLEKAKARAADADTADRPRP